MTVLMTVEAPATPDPLRRRVPAMIGPAAGVLMALLAVLGTWLALDPGGRSLHGLMDDNV